MTDATVMTQIGQCADQLDHATDLQTFVKLTNAIHNLVRAMRYSRGELDTIESSEVDEDFVGELVEKIKKHARGALNGMARTSDPDALSMAAQSAKNLGASLAWLRGEVTIDYDAAIAYLHSTLENPDDD